MTNRFPAFRINKIRFSIISEQPVQPSSSFRSSKNEKTAASIRTIKVIMHSIKIGSQYSVFSPGIAPITIIVIRAHIAATKIMNYTIIFTMVELCRHICLSQILGICQKCPTVCQSPLTHFNAHTIIMLSRASLTRVSHKKCHATSWTVPTVCYPK